MKWKILNINEDGTVDLISDRPTRVTTVYYVNLSGEKGYKNSQKLLENIV